MEILFGYGNTILFWRNTILFEKYNFVLEKYYFVLVVSSQRGEAGTQEKDEKAGEHLQRQREVKRSRFELLLNQ